MNSVNRTAFTPETDSTSLNDMKLRFCAAHLITVATNGGMALPRACACRETRAKEAMMAGVSPSEGEAFHPKPRIQAVRSAHKRTARRAGLRNCLPRKCNR